MEKTSEKKENNNNQTENKNVTKVRYKAEATRHFSRYKIPAYIEIDGKKYELEDWSVAGCGIKGLPEEIRQRKWAKVNFICPFDVFDATIKDIKVEFLYRAQDDIVGCRFTELRPDQLSLLQDIIEGYLEGSISSIDNFINVIKREDLRESIEARRPKPPAKEGFEETLRKIFIFTILGIIVLLLVFFLLKSLYIRVYTVETVSAFFDAKLAVIRVPTDGAIRKKKEFVKGQKIKKGELIGIVESPITPSVVISSPVNGTIYKSNFRNMDIVITGDPILAILPNNEKIFVTASILHKDLNRIKIGQEVTVVKGNGEILNGKIIDIEGGPYLSSLHSIAPPPTYSTAWNYDKIKIEIDKNIDIKELKKSVIVNIDITPSFLKPVFKLLP
jgi:alginate biosynthesis protein Alg44